MEFISETVSLLIGLSVLFFFCYYVFFRPLKMLFTDKGNRLYWVIALAAGIWMFAGIWLWDWMGKNYESGQTMGITIYFIVSAAIVIPLIVWEIRGK